MTGEVDLASVDEFRQALLGDEPARLAGRRVVVDLADVDFLDSSGLAVLLEAASRASAVVLAHPPPVVRRILDATGVGDRFTVRS